jgi:hypothetical protein
MNKDELLPVIKDIEKFCRENKLLIFYGTMYDSDITIVEWNDNTKGDWKIYLNLAKSLNCQIVTIEVERNEIDTDEQAIFNCLESLEEEDRDIFQEALRNVKNSDGEIVSFTLSFFYNGICYQYGDCSDLYIDYVTVKHGLEESKADKDAKRKRLTEEEIGKAARRILTNEKFLACKTTQERMHVGRELAKNDGIDDVDFIETFKVARKADQLYMQEIHPIKEEELKKKIRELKSKGMKKIEVKNKLGIGQAALDRHWY